MIESREHAVERIENADLPEGWTCEEAYLSGNMKLIVKLRCGDETIDCLPFKTYDDVPGFCDAHRITHRPAEGATETLAKGHEVELSHEAADVVLEAVAERGE